MFLDQIKVADLHVTAGLLQLCPDLCVFLSRLLEGRASLIQRHLPIDTLDVPAKLCNSWWRGTKFESVLSEVQKEFRRSWTKFRQISEKIENKYRTNLNQI